jgi:hypothetical protein
MMCMMGCFAVVQMNPFSLLLHPSNLAVAGGLLIGAVAVALRRPGFFAVGLAAAAVTAIAGALGAAGVRGIKLPGNPIIWVVIGLYIAFRLTLIQQSERRQQQADALRSRLPRGAGGADEPGADEPGERP